jgi:hypothetical protein
MLSKRESECTDVSISLPTVLAVLAALADPRRYAFNGGHFCTIPALFFEEKLCSYI